MSPGNAARLVMLGNVMVTPGTLAHAVPTVSPCRDAGNLLCQPDSRH